MFAECRSSDTRQNQSLPSASDETLGKHNFAECLKKYTRQTSSRAPHAPVTVGWRSGRIVCRVPDSKHSANNVTCTAHDCYHDRYSVTPTGTSYHVRYSYQLPSARCRTLGNVLSMPSALCWHSASSHLCRVSFLALGKVREKHFHLPSKLFSLLLQYVMDIIYNFGKLSLKFTIFTLFISLKAYFVDNSNLNYKMQCNSWIINGKSIFMLLSPI